MASLHLGDVAPDFEQDSSIGRIRFHSWIGDDWAVLFSHPADFTPVCTTELGLTSKLKGEFAKRGVKVIALSVDPVESHKKWIEDINSTQRTTVDFPIIADADLAWRRPATGDTATMWSSCRPCKIPRLSSVSFPKVTQR